jgi:hypothetical protein
MPIAVATIWHAFRAYGMEDKIFGRTWLLERLRGGLYNRFIEPMERPSAPRATRKRTP